ncbi:MAG: UbiA family prenyltransferase [Phycisphaerae bacterium]
MSPKTRAWLQLLRLPNLFTVPGDPLAGFTLGWLVLAARSSRPVDAIIVPAVLAMLASLLLYCAGLLANDYFDLEEDRRERPGRPLPSGRANPRTVILAAVAMAVAAVALAYLAQGWACAAVAGALAVAIFAYDAWLKRTPVVGKLVMGGCRGLSCLLGSAAAGGLSVMAEPVVIAFAAGAAVYVAAVTAVAARETGQAPVGIRRLLPVAGMIAWLVALNMGGLVSCHALFLAFWPVGVLQILAVGWTIACAESLKGVPAATAAPPAVGKLIRGLLLVQASVVLWFGVLGWAGLVPAAVLVAFWPISAIIGRRVYAS